MKSIQDCIDDALIREPYPPSGKFVPYMFGRCYRAQYWHRKNMTVSNPPDKRAMRVFKAGDLFHDFVAEQIQKNGYWIREYKIELEDIKGRADLVGLNEVADIKSQHSRAFWHQQKADKEDITAIRKTKFNNWLQVMFYAVQLDKQYGRLIFVSKDDLCITEYVEPVKGFWEENVECEIMMLRKIWKDDLLPPAEPRCWIGKDGKSKECDYCNWKNTCEEIERGKMLCLKS